MHRPELYQSTERSLVSAGDKQHLQDLHHDSAIASASTVSAHLDPNGQSVPTGLRKKKRVYTSCRQCRQRRCACSREYPCYACAARNEGEQCDWTGASPQFMKSKGQVSRDSLLARLESPARLGIKQDFESLHGHVESLIDLLRQKFPSSSTAISRPEIVPVTNYHIEDVATQLSRFTLSQAIRYKPERPFFTNPSSPISVREVEEYVEQEEKRSLPNFSMKIGSAGFIDAPHSIDPIPSSSTSPVRDGLLGIGKGPTSFEAILEGLPSRIQIKACLDQYEYHKAWMHRILHRPTFWNQVSKQIQHSFAYTNQRAQAHWLAILLSVCGLGLFNNAIKAVSTLKDYELPISVKDQRALALRWCRAAASCLEIGAFETAPSIDSISAMAILAQLPLYTSNGETLGLALEFIGRAIDLAMQLELHIDPDSHPVYQNATHLVKQNRRRLMVALLCQHYKMGGLLCQNHELRPLEQFSSLQLPLDQFDEDFSEDGQLTIPRAPGSTHTIMTGVRSRFQVARIWQEIGIIFSNPIEPPTHEAVSKINAKLQKLPSQLPETIWTEFDSSTCAFVPPFTLPPLSSPSLRVLLIDRLACFAVFAAATVRLHRGFLTEMDGVPVEDTKMHREQVYHYGRAMLAIHRTKVFPLENVPLQFFVLSCTVSLAVYCLTQKSPEEDEKCEIVAKELEQIRNVLKLCTGLSSILRRTFAVLEFALNKWTTVKHGSHPVKSRPYKRLKAAADNQSQQHLNDINFTRNQILRGSQVQLSSGGDNRVAGLEPQEDSVYDPHMMENLAKILMQDQQWADDFDLTRDKLPNQDPQPPCPSSFAPIPINLDSGDIFQFRLAHPTITDTSVVSSGHPVSNSTIADTISTALQSSGSSIATATDPTVVSNAHPLHNQELQPPCPSSFAQIHVNLDSGNIFQGRLAHPTTIDTSAVGNAHPVRNATIANTINTALQSSGSSISYLSPSSSSPSHLLLPSAFNGHELNTAPISFNHLATFTLGTNVNEIPEYATHQSLRPVAYPALSQHSITNTSCVNNETIPGNTKTYLDSNFEIAHWSANSNACNAAHNVLNSKSM